MSHTHRQQRTPETVPVQRPCRMVGSLSHTHQQRNTPDASPTNAEKEQEGEERHIQHQRVRREVEEAECCGEQRE